MQDSIKHLEILGLDRAERSILAALLGSGTHSVAIISTNIGFPRMTTHDALKRLHEKGFVRKVSVGKRTEWKAVDIAKLQGRVDSAFSVLRSMQEPLSHFHTLEQVDARDIGIYAFHGKHQIKQAYEEIFSERTASSQVKVIDGHNFFSDYFKYISEPDSEISFAEAIRRSGNIFHALMAESNIDSLHEAKLSEDIYREMFAAPLNISTISNAAVSFSAEIALFEDKMTVFMPKKLSLLVVRQPELLSSTKALYTQLELRAKPINTFELLQSLIGQAGR